MTPVVAPVVAAAAGPAVLVVASVTALDRVRWSPVDVVAVNLLVGLTLGMTLAHPLTEMVVLLPLAVLGSAAAVVDAREGRLPDAVTAPLLGCTLIAALAVGGVAAVPAAAAGAIGAGLLKVIASEAVGWGDVKLVPTLVVVLGHHGVVAQGAVLACVLVLLTAGGVGLTDRRTRNVVVPYGPALVFRTIAAAAL